MVWKDAYLTSSNVGEVEQHTIGGAPSFFLSYHLHNWFKTDKLGSLVM